MFKYKIGDKITVMHNNILFVGKIIKFASIDEFGMDFYFDEKNYVVEFNSNTIPIASYNKLENDGTFKYIMTESDII